MVKAILRTCDLKTNEEIARILLDTKTKQILDITIHKKHLRFKCKQCAIFCCKLGGPQLTKKDVQRIEQAGYTGEGFIIRFRDGSDCSSAFLGSLRSEEDGSCIFLKFNPEEDSYECSIYDCRPTLCKLYPFEFHKIDSQSIMITLIPCCLGLNNPEGELVDEKFIVDSLFIAIS
jgi:Fe-S-cluster containining protein